MRVVCGVTLDKPLSSFPLSVFLHGSTYSERKDFLHVVQFPTTPSVRLAVVIWPLVKLSSLDFWHIPGLVRPPGWSLKHFGIHELDHLPNETPRTCLLLGSALFYPTARCQDSAALSQNRNVSDQVRAVNTTRFLRSMS